MIHRRDAERKKEKKNKRESAEEAESAERAHAGMDAAFLSAGPAGLSPGVAS
jgi:hypothetical protein